jgi:Fe-S-cluster-containing dehydrogenase component
MMNKNTDDKYVMLIDLDSCSGCHACSVACKAEHRAPTGEFRHRVQIVEQGTFPSVSRKFIPTLCLHCTDAPCLQSCPVEAISRTDSGIVEIDQDMCIGSGACVGACPYGAIYLDSESMTAVKCDFCHDRLNEGEQPACAATCPTDAILFGFKSEPEISRQLQTGQYTQWEPAETAPRVWYKGLDIETERQLARINKQ